MFSLLIFVIMLSLGISFICSLMEAALLTVPLSYAQSTADQQMRSGKRLLGFKLDVGAPISAILILNTISHTVGATISGALVDKIYGNQALMWFSILFTFLILYLSEIIPKQLGAVFCKRVSLLIANPLSWLITIFYPLILTTNWFARMIKGVSKEPSISTHEILSMAKIGSQEGALDTLEHSVIRNIILLDRHRVIDVLTPRTVVFKLAEDTCIGDLRDSICDWNHTRIPLYSKSDPDIIIGYVTQRDVLRKLLDGDSSVTLKELLRPIEVVPNSMPLDKLFVQLAETREPIRVVVDEYGIFTGIVTLEDIIEEIVGKEIVDEYDIVSDLRQYAKALFIRRKKSGW